MNAATATAPEAMLARIKPRDGKRYKARTYTLHVNGDSIKFLEPQGWYQIDPSLAAVLRPLRQKEHDPESPPVFDVCTETEARAMDEAARVRAERRSAADAAGPGTPAMRVHDVRREQAAAAADRASPDLTTADLRAPAAPRDPRPFAKPQPPPTPKVAAVVAPEPPPEPAPTEPEPADMAPDLSGDFDADMSPASPPPATTRGTGTGPQRGAPKKSAAKRSPPDLE